MKQTVHAKELLRYFEQMDAEARDYKHAQLWFTSNTNKVLHLSKGDISLVIHALAQLTEDLAGDR